jgi:hypothetical protein
MKILDNNNMRKIESPSHNILKNYALFNTFGIKLTHNPFECVFVASFYSFCEFRLHCNALLNLISNYKMSPKGYFK